MRFATSFSDLYNQIKLRKVPFLVAFFVTVVVSYSVLYAIDFVPEPISEEDESEIVMEDSEFEEVDLSSDDSFSVDIQNEVAYPNPVKITFHALDDKEVQVNNPISRDIEVLDQSLLTGAVRHPDSADFSEDGNIFILAHSSYLPNVLNSNFQAFNGIQNMTWGDKISVDSEDKRYVYRVEKVYEAAASDVLVPFTPGEARLTLATCDSFGSKDDRFIVEAVQIEVIDITS